ncbi:MAG: SPFH domain-containing protein [Actinomycetota bacterium]
MGEIRKYPFVRHFRGEPTFHTLLYRDGELRRSGSGLASWFQPLRVSIAEVPLDDREAVYLFRARTLDFQEATVQGAVTYRVADPEMLARRMDFTVDLDTGLFTKTPLEQLAGMITQLAQQFTVDHLARLTLGQVLAEGVSEIRSRISEGLALEGSLTEMGVHIVAVRVAAVSPTSELERALQTPTFESIHQQADEATFQRRALAVEKERSIAENELQNQIELSRREEELTVRRGEIQRRRVEDEAAAARIESEGDAERTAIFAEAQAGRVRLVEGATAEMERKRMDAYRDLPVGVLAALALREVATKLERIDHLNLTPDLLTPLLGNLLSNHSRQDG